MSQWEVRDNDGAPPISIERETGEACEVAADNILTYEIADTFEDALNEEAVLKKIADLCDAAERVGTPLITVGEIRHLLNGGDPA